MRCARRTCGERVQSHDLALVLRGHDAWCRSGIHTSRGADRFGQHALHTRSARVVLWTARGFRLPLLMMTAITENLSPLLIPHHDGYGYSVSAGHLTAPRLEVESALQIWSERLDLLSLKNEIPSHMLETALSHLCSHVAHLEGTVIPVLERCLDDFLDLHPDERCPILHRGFQAPLKRVEHEIDNIEALIDLLDKAMWS